ncbi:MAG: outer membrane beta-barrel protein, partial [Rhodospirillales bacterium]
DQDFDRVGLTVDAIFDRVDYTNTSSDDDGDILNNDRDRNVYSTPVRLGFEINPDYEAFVRLSPNVRRYDQTPDEAGIDRDSWGYTAAGGLAVDFGGITFGEIYAGYLQQFYDDSDLDNVSAPTFGGALAWNATTLTTVSVAVERAVFETTATGASAYVSTSGELTVDHELLRNVILTAGGAVTNNDYEGINRTDWFYIGNLSARYLLNRNLYLSAGYLFRHRTSDEVNNFDQNVFRIGLQTQL